MYTVGQKSRNRPFSGSNKVTPTHSSVDDSQINLVQDSEHPSANPGFTTHK